MAPHFHTPNLRKQHIYCLFVQKSSNHLILGEKKLIDEWKTQSFGYLPLLEQLTSIYSWSGNVSSSASGLLFLSSSFKTHCPRLFDETRCAPFILIKHLLFMYFYTCVWKRIKEKLVHLFLLFLYEAINDTDRHLNSYSSKQYLMHCARFTKWLMFLYFFPMIFRPGIRTTGQSVLKHSPRIFFC